MQTPFLDFFFKLVTGIVLCGFLLTFAGIVISAYLGYQCYAGGDPNSMACYMVSERVELGIRHR